MLTRRFSMLRSSGGTLPVGGVRVNAATYCVWTVHQQSQVVALALSLCLPCAYTLQVSCEFFIWILWLERRCDLPTFLGLRRTSLAISAFLRQTTTSVSTVISTGNHFLLEQRCAIMFFTVELEFDQSVSSDLEWQLIQFKLLSFNEFAFQC